MPKLTYTTPPPSLMRELKEVAAHAAALAHELARANRLPGDFPAGQLHELLDELQTLPEGTAEGCRQPLEYARARLPAIRRRFIQTEEQSRAPREDQDTLPPVTRGMTIDLQLGALVNAITTALDEYRELASIEEDEATDTAPSLDIDPAAPDIAGAMASAHRAEAAIGENLTEFAAMAQPGSANAENFRRQMRDTRGLLSLARIELRMPAFVPRWYRKAADAITDYPAILRGTASLLQAGVDIARPLADAWHKFEHGLFKAMLDGLEHAATGLQGVARKWEADGTARDDNLEFASPPPRFSQKDAENMIAAGRAPPLDWRPFISKLAFGSGKWNDDENILEFQTSNSKLSIDLHLLAGLNQLKRLGLVSTVISDLSPLQSLPRLQDLGLVDTEVLELTSLSRLTGLQHLDLIDTGHGNLNFLNSLTRLQSLEISGDNVTDISPIASLVNLKYLSLDDTKIRDLSPLAGLTALQALDLDNTRVSDLKPLTGLTALQWLSLNNTEVSVANRRAFDAERKRRGLPKVEIIGVPFRKRTKRAGQA